MSLLAQRVERPTNKPELLHKSPLFCEKFHKHDENFTKMILPLTNFTPFWGEFGQNTAAYDYGAFGSILSKIGTGFTFDLFSDFGQLFD